MTQRRKRSIKVSSGVGDKVEKFTEKTGIKKIVKFIAGEDCGCDERKKKLNDLFQSKILFNCLNEQDYNYLIDNLDILNGKTTPKPSIFERINTIYAKTFGVSIQLTNCGSCWMDYMKNLNKVIKVYEDENSENKS